MNLNGSGNFARRNVIAGGSNGFSVNGSGHTVQGNFIGTDATGTVLLGLSQRGVGVAGTDHVIGGAGPGEGNVIGGAGFYYGLEIAGSGHVVYGNFVGTDVTGTLDFGNLRAGIAAGGTNMTIGGTSPGQGNTIAFNGTTFGEGGVVNSGGQQVRIRGNRIYANKATGASNGLGIDLLVGLDHGRAHPTTTATRDTGPNGVQNYPILTSAGPALAEGAGTHIVGVLNSTASTTFDIDFYANPSCASRPQEYLEGQDYIGSTQVTTDGSGNASIDVTLPFTVENGSRISATATDPAGNTSEFSQRLIFSMNPASGPPAGGTDVTITGMLFDERRHRLDRRPAGHERQRHRPDADHRDDAGASAGSLNNVVVTNPNQTGGHARQRLGRGFLRCAEQPAVLLPHHQARRERDHGRLRHGRLLPAQFRHAAADGGLPAEVEERPVLRPAAVRRDLPRRALLEQLRAVDRGPGGRRDHGRLRRRQLLPHQPRDPPADGGLPPEDQARLELRASRLQRRLRRRAVPVAVRRLDRAALGRRHHRRLRRHNYCPTQAVRRDQMAAFLYNTFQF